MTCNINNVVHLISINAQGLGSLNKQARFREWIKQQKAHIIYVQETHFTESIETKINQFFDKWNIFNSFGSSASKGVSIFISKALDYDIIDHFFDKNGRYVIINFQISKSIYSLIN